MNGEAVNSEIYHQAEGEFLNWKDSLDARPFDPEAYLSCRDDQTGLSDLFHALLEHWQP